MWRSYQDFVSCLFIGFYMQTMVQDMVWSRRKGFRANFRAFAWTELVQLQIEPRHPERTAWSTMSSTHIPEITHAKWNFERDRWVQVSTDNKTCVENNITRKVFVNVKGTRGMNITYKIYAHSRECYYCCVITQPHNKNNSIWNGSTHLYWKMCTMIDMGKMHHNMQINVYRDYGMTIHNWIAMSLT